MRTALALILLCSACEIAAFDTEGELATISAVVDDWHAAASEADERRYLDHFSPDAVFMGTDPDERWTLAQFTAYVKKHFPDGGWTYHPHERVVVLSDDRRLAWFDEELTHGSYGELRGTGVMRKGPAGWKLTHYSMTFTIPNGVGEEVVRVVTDWLARQPEAVDEP